MTPRRISITFIMIIKDNLKDGTNNKQINHAAIPAVTNVNTASDNNIAVDSA
jgi:hypothetical protein